MTTSLNYGDLCVITVDVATAVDWQTLDAARVDLEYILSKDQNTVFIVIHNSINEDKIMIRPINQHVPTIWGFMLLYLGCDHCLH